MQGIIQKLKQSIKLGLSAPSLDNRAHVICLKVEIGTQASSKSTSSKQHDGHTPKARISLGATVDALTHAWTLTYKQQALLQLLQISQQRR